MNEQPNMPPSLQQRIEEDKARDEAGQSRVDKVHGGEVVELIMPENIQPDYDTKCQHKRRELDESETAFDSVICLDCPMVWNYDYGVVRSTIKS